MNETINQQTLLDLDATTIAKKIKTKEITSEGVVHTYIEHIKKINPALNAVVEDRFTTSLAEAREMDQNHEITNDKGPLYGVPISVKESFDVKNMKTTGGLVHRQDLIARNDADVITKLKNAGAIILGKTNTPTLCFCQETDNKLYGRTNNPWDLTRTPGGSSGGEGALLAAGGAVAGIGSDIGGSIRFPSHFNGVVGFKPGKFQVSSAGHFPANLISLQERMVAMGPLGKSVRDTKLLYNIIANNTTTTQSLQETKVDILPGNITYPLSTKTKELLNKINDFLRKTHSTSRSIPPLFDDSAQLWQEIMSINGGEDIEKLAFINDRENAFTSYAKEKLTGKTETHRYLSWALIGSKLFKPSASRIKTIERIITKGDDELSNYLNNRLLVFPVYHTGARKHGKLYKEIFSIRKTFLEYMPFIAYANVWGLPSLIVPVGTDENNLPISVQIMSINGNEDRIFQLGELLENKFRGFIRSTELD